MRKCTALAGLTALVVGTLISPSRGETEEILSAYSCLDLEKCAMIQEEGDDPAENETWRCAGYGGMDVLISVGDLRMYVSYGPRAEEQKAASQTAQAFNTLGDLMEWRLTKEGDQVKPFATILRYKWSMDDLKGEKLIVAKIAGDEACHVAHIDATGNLQANEQARTIADRDARSFSCADEPKHYDAQGHEISE
jgi:hypothetical protein